MESRNWGCGCGKRKLDSANKALQTALARVAQSSEATTSVAAANGLQTVTFDTLYARVIVHLPDDMAAGDTISGTVFAEPKGSTPEERAKSLGLLKGLVVEIGDKPIEPFSVICKEDDAIRPCPATFFLYHTDEKRPKTPVVLKTKEGTTVAETGIPVFDPTQLKPTITFDPPKTESAPPQNVKATAPEVPQSDAARTQPNAFREFRLPKIGQQGRAVEITGSFDGNSSNTTLTFKPISGTSKDFEKTTQNVSGGFGLIRPLAESPRKIVFRSPSDFTGPVEISLREGNKETKGTYRNVGVRLSAPKTNLMKGESTELTVEVSGLEGIQKDVPLQLDSKGVIAMEGGNFQNLRISPSEVNRDGVYNTTRAITGQEAGAFNVTATVVVGPFDVCLQDDSTPARVVLWNSSTGDYIFNCGGCLPPPGPKGTTGPAGTPGQGGKKTAGGTIQPRGTTAGPSGAAGILSVGYSSSLTGTGQVTMKGCIITLQHNAPDRRVMGTIDACNKTGNASVQIPARKWTFTITDSTPADNCSVPQSWLLYGSDPEFHNMRTNKQPDRPAIRP
ncbi:MAG: hypothetical protein ACREBG_22445 [Pyrinomonadaceae bacterium]